MILKKSIFLKLLFMYAPMSNKWSYCYLRYFAIIQMLLVLLFSFLITRLIFSNPTFTSCCTCFPPFLYSLSKRHFSLAFLPCFILPLVSLMNGFTEGKVLIFISLSDFCWLLLISNTLRKASESINKEMNTLHSAILQLSQSFTSVVGAQVCAGKVCSYTPS